MYLTQENKYLYGAWAAGTGRESKFGEWKTHKNIIQKRAEYIEIFVR